MAMYDILVRVGADINDYMKSLDQARKHTDGLQKSVESASKAVDKQADVAKKSGDELEQYNAKAASTAFGVGGALLSMAAAAAAAMAGPIKVASDFEDAFAGVQKTVSATPAEFEALEREIRGLAKEMPVAAESIAGVAEEAGRLGLEKDELVEFSRVMIMLGETTDMSASAAATSIARFMNIMGTSQEYVENLGSALTYMGNETASTESEILELSRRLAGSAVQIGLSESEVIGIAATMADLGIQAEAGGTAMQKTFLTMNTAVMDGGKELEGFAKVAGMTATDFKRLFETDARGAIEAFINGLNRMGDSGEDVTTILRDLGLGNERTLDTLLRLSSAHENLGVNMDKAAGAYEEGAALSTEYEKRLGTLSSQLRLLWNRWREILIIIGQPLMSALLAVTKALEPLFKLIEWGARKFDELSGPTKAVIGLLLMLVPILLAVAGGISMAVGGWKLMVGALGVVGGALVKFIGGIKAVSGALTILSGPVGWTVAAIAGIGVAVAGVITWFKRKNKALEEMKEATEETVSRIDELNQSVSNSRREHKDAVRGIYSHEKANRNLLESINELASKENLSSSEKKRLLSQIDELNSGVDGLTLAYDEYSGSLNMSTEQIERQISIMKDRSALEEYERRLVEIAEERNKAEGELEEINRQRSEYNDMLLEGGRAYWTAKDGLEELDEAEGQLINTVERLGTEFEITQKKMEEAHERIDRNVAKTVAEQGASYEVLKDNQKSVIDSLISEYDNLVGAATNMFDKISTKSETSFAEMEKNLKHNIKAVEEWGTNLDQLVEWGVDQGLIEHLRQAGPESAAEVAEIVKQGKEAALGFGDLYNDSVKTANENLLAGLNISDEAREVILEVVSNMDQSFAEGISKAEFEMWGKEIMNDIANGVDVEAEKVRKSSARAAEYSVYLPIKDGLGFGKFNVIGEDIMSGLESGVKDGKAGVKGAVEDVVGDVVDLPLTMLEIRSPSRLYYSYGSDTLAGFVDGLVSKQGDLLTTITDIISGMAEDSRSGLKTVGEAFNAGVNNIDNRFGRLPSLTGRTMTRMNTVFKTQSGTQVATMRSLSSRLTGAFSGLSGSLTSIASNAMSGLQRGLQSRVGGIMNTARSIASSVTSTIKGALKIQSPSKIMAEIGYEIIRGLDVGIKSNMGRIEKASKMLAEVTNPELPDLGRVDVIQSASVGHEVYTRVQTDIGDLESDSRHETELLREIRDELRKQKQMIVEMDGRTVGRMIEPHVRDKQESLSRHHSKWRLG